MYEQTTAIESMDNFYKTLLFFYPKKYRQQFGQEMLFIFQDLYQEEISKFGKIRLSFWFSIFTDITQSVFREHLSMIRQSGLKKYLHINNYNILGGILLLPFILLFTAGFLARINQGDLTHYNRAWYAIISRAFFYGGFSGQTQAEWTILVLLPFLAILINLIPLFFSLQKKISLKRTFWTNFISVVILLAGLFCLVVVFGHDVIPCSIHGLINHHGLMETIFYCKDA